MYQSPKGGKVEQHFAVSNIITHQTLSVKRYVFESIVQLYNIKYLR